MTFTSLYFFAFVLAALILYYVLPKKIRWVVLLVASVTFYCICSFKYIAFIIFTALSTFLGALWIQNVSQKTKIKVKENKETWTLDQKKAYKQKQVVNKRLILALILVLNFGILFVLKYTNFLLGSITTVFGLPSIELGLVLPLGISFYTFQTMGYAIDVYREKTKAEKNFAKFGLFVSFFPQIIQGPIAVYDDLAHQLYEGHELKFLNIKYGFELILWGLFKKMIIADRLSILINTVLADKGKYGGEMMLVTALAYAAQLYMDFSGGIDIARGVAEMFGITMAENFKRPYFSKTIAEYWRRWHITLGAWMKNYVFYSLAMSKAFLKLGKNTKKKLGGHVGKVLPGSIATFIVFLLIGIWHGANWKYVGFGLWNAIIIFASNLLEPVFEGINTKLKIRTKSLSFRIVQMIRTFIIVLIGYYFDIADGFMDALNMMKRSIFDAHLGNLTESKIRWSLGLTAKDYAIVGIGLAIVFFVSLYQERSQQKVRDTLEKQSIWAQWVVLLAGLLLILTLGMYGPGISVGEFVYMQF